MSVDLRDSDQALLIAWRQGDERAAAALLSRHYGGVARFFENNVGQHSARDDLVQATFLGLLEGIDRFREEATFKTYLFSIARKKLYRHLRDQARDHRLGIEVGVQASPCTPLSQVLVRNERNAQLFRALDTLAMDTRLMLELHYWHDLRIKEIAEVMELPVTTVKDRMHRGRKQMLVQLNGSA